MVVCQEGGYAPEYAPYCSATIAETMTGPGNARAGPDRALQRPRRQAPRQYDHAFGADAAAAIDRAATAAAEMGGQSWTKDPPLPHGV